MRSSTGFRGLAFVVLAASATRHALRSEAWAGEPGEGVKLLWSYEVPNWVPRSVSIGDGTQQIFFARGGYSDQASLFSAFDEADSPSPVWQSPPHPGLTHRNVTASAVTPDLHAQIRLARTAYDSPLRAVVEAYRSSSPSAIWSFEFPFDVVDQTQAGIECARDGSLVLAWVYRSAAAGIDFAVFGPDSPQPQQYRTLQLFGPAKGVCLSADGRTLYASSFTYSFVLDVPSWSILQQTASYTGVDFGRAVSRDGSVYAQSLQDGRVLAYRRSAGDYELAFQHDQPEAAGAVCRFIALSADGSMLAIAYDVAPYLLEVRLQVVDLARPDQPVVLDDRITGLGTLDNLVGDLCLSSDGKALALGLWGDEAGRADELRVYRRNGSRWGLSLSRALRGSVVRLQFSEDGRRLLAANKSTHANIAETGGDVALFQVGEEDLRLYGVPSVGNRVTLEHRLPPGRLSRSILANDLNQPPLPFPNVGTLYLDRQDLHVFASGVADEDGIARTSYTIPIDPARIGTTVYFQSLQAAPRRLSKDWIQMTILP